MGTFNGNILPTATGLDLGSPSQQWDAYLRNAVVSGYLSGGTIIDARQYAGATFSDTLTNALAVVSSTGGIIDCRGITGAQSFSANVTINQANTTILFGNCVVSCGTYGIIVPVSKHGVSLIGCTGAGSSAAAAGTVFTYTGAAAAIKVGDSSANTFRFLAQDITIAMTGANTSTGIGFQLNRCVNYALIRPVVYGTATLSNTQKLIDLEGTGDFTGGLIQWPYLNNGGYGIYFGTASNANTVIGGQIPGLSTGVGIDMVDNASGGNFILGPDIENQSIGVRCAQSYNFITFRGEGNTKMVQLDAGATSNRISAVPMSPSSITNNSANTTNSFDVTGVSTPAWNGSGGFVLRPFIDAEMDWIITPGSAANQKFQMIVRDKSSTNKFAMVVDETGNIALQDGTISRFLAVSGNTSLAASSGVNAVNVNDVANSGTGGLAVYSGGASPASVATISSSGLGTFNGGLNANNAGIAAAGALSGVTTATVGTSLTVGSGTAITQVKKFFPNISPTSVTAASVEEQTFALSGLSTSDVIVVNPPAISNATGIAGARVSATDTLAIRFVNPTVGALAPTTGVYTVIAFRS